MKYKGKISDPKDLVTKEYVDGKFVPKYKLTITLIGNQGNIPVGNTAMVYLKTPLGNVLYNSFLYEEPTTITIPEGATYLATGTQDVEGFINPGSVEGTILGDTSITITYKEFGSIENFDDIGELAYLGVAKQYMDVGDVLENTYTDHSGTQYTFPWKVMDFGTCVLEDGRTFNNVPIMAPFPYCTVESMPFHDREALFANVGENPITAGTYYFDITATYDTWATGKSYQFTLTKDLPANGQIRVPTWGAPEGLEIRTYADGNATSQIESITLTEGNTGTKLGELHSTYRYEDTGCNALQRVRYGNGNYKEAYQRQWLAKRGMNGTFFSLQNPWDIKPSNVTSFNGFQDGLPEEMLRNVPAARVRTAYNTVGESTSPNYYDVYDKFFLMSIEQVYGSPQLADVEGPFFECYKQATGLTSRSNAANDGRKHYAINSKTSAQIVRLRSCSRGYANSTWYVYTSGEVNGYNAGSSNRCCPACYVIKVPDEEQTPIA